jgi:hypothetical protein
METRELKQALESLRDSRGLGLLRDELDAIRERPGLGSEAFEAGLRDAAQALVDFQSAIRCALDAVSEPTGDINT